MKNKLPVRDCIINEFYRNANDPIYYRMEYCKKNCRYRCLNNADYKKKEGVNHEGAHHKTISDVKRKD